MRIQCFHQEEHFTNFFPKVNNLNTYCAYFFRASWNFSGQEDIDITFPTGKLFKKLISTLGNRH